MTNCRQGRISALSKSSKKKNKKQRKLMHNKELSSTLCALGLRTLKTKSTKRKFRSTIDFVLILTNVFCISFCICTFENANGISSMLKLWETFCVYWLEMQHC